MEGVSIVTLIATASISTAVGLIAAALWGVLRKKAVAHVKISSPEQRELKRLGSAVRRHSFLHEIGSDRQAMHARGLIVLAGAVKSGNQDQVDKALDLITASESQYLAAMSARLTRDDQVEDAESAEEPR